MGNLALLKISHRGICSDPSATMVKLVGAREGTPLPINSRATMVKRTVRRYSVSEMEIALIGLRGSGKTTLFNVLTGASRKQGRPVDGRGQSQKGVSKVPDPRLEALTRVFGPKKVTPAEIAYWDVLSGEVAESREGVVEGQALNILQGADALIHVVRAFDDPTAPHQEGRADPARDVDAMAGELALSDMVILERRSQRAADSMKGARGRERDLLLKEQALLERVRGELEDGRPVVEQCFSREETSLLANYHLLTAKPLLVAYNAAEEEVLEGAGAKDPPAAEGERDGKTGVSLCASLEWEFAQLSEEEEREFRESMGAEESGRERLIGECLGLLGMVTFFTFVSQEVRAWTVPRGTGAAKAAGKIHSDMERGFIRAEVVHFEEMMTSGSIAEARKQGVLRAEGKSYEVQDGDVITFLFNV